jgi:AraC-like DNA-binding protein
VTARANRVTARANVMGGAVASLREVTVAASLAADMVSYLDAHGVDGAAVCRRAGLDLGLVDGSAVERIPARTMVAFWREAILAADDPDLGLHTSADFNPGALDIVGYVMLSSRTADEALRRGARLMRLLNDGMALEVIRGRASTVCRIVWLESRPNPFVADPRQLVDSVLLGVVRQLSLLTQRTVTPLAVTVRHAKPAHGDSEYRRLFGTTTRFKAAVDSVELRNADLDVALRSGNAALLTTFEAHADAALAALGARDTLAGRVVAEIVADLKGEPPAIAQVAKALAISPRHLQRGLAAEGATFKGLLDDARREVALRHLESGTSTVAQVAWLVGFSEASAFHRAFRRWTGHAPRAHP